MSSSKATGKTYLVVGGCGFLGRHIVEQLLARGEKNVRVFDIRKGFEDERVMFFVGSIRSTADLLPAMRGVTTVFNTVSPPHGASYQLYFDVNVEGTRTLLEVGGQCGVKEFIHTSSSSVVFDGHDLNGVDETYPFAKKHLDPYNQTKEIAEREVLAANGKNGVLTVALRPSGIFGPRDGQFFPTVVQAAHKGQWKFQIGSGKNKQDFTYVTNVADAHILTSDKIKSGSGIDGEVFNITNDEPCSPWRITGALYKGLGYGEPYIQLPLFMMWYLSLLMDLIVWLLSPFVTLHPTFTHFRIASVAANRWFNMDKAKKVLGYKPKVSLQEGIDRAVEYFVELEKKKSKQ